MPRLYTAEFEGVAVSAVQDLFNITPADDKPCWVVGWWLSQYSDLKDAEEEVVRWRWIRGNTSAGSGGSTPTPRPFEPSDTAAGAVVHCNDTTVASSGTPVNLLSHGMNIRMPEPLILPEKLWIPVTQAQGILAMRLQAAPADALSMSGTLFFVEAG